MSVPEDVVSKDVVPTSIAPQSKSQWLYRICAILTFIAIVPPAYMRAFYDWTNADQSRLPPIVPWIAIVLSLVSISAIIHILRTPQSLWTGDSKQANPWQIGIFQIIAFTSFVALQLALIQRAQQYAFIGNIILWMIAVGYSISNHRRLILLATLTACMYGPFDWIFLSADSLRRVELLKVMCLAPAIFPSVYSLMLVQGSINDSEIVSQALSSVELGFGLWICNNVKLAIAFFVVVLTCSIFGSFILHALMRA